MSYLLCWVLCLVFWDINSNLQNKRHRKLRGDSHTSSSCFPRQPAIITPSRFAGARPQEQQSENNSMGTRHEKHCHRGSGRQCFNSFREVTELQQQALSITNAKALCNRDMSEFLLILWKGAVMPRKTQLGCRSHLCLLSLPQLETINTGKNGLFILQSHVWSIL